MNPAEPTPTPTEPTTPPQTLESQEAVASANPPSTPEPEIVPSVEEAPKTESGETTQPEPTEQATTPAATAQPPADSSSDTPPSTTDEPLGAAPVAVAPALPPQPVPTVAPAPQPHDLSRIAQDLQIRKGQVEAVVQLLDEGNTVPFITRYRKERTGGLDEVVIRRIQDRVTHLRDLAARKQTILRSIALQGRLNDELVDAILHAENPKRLEDLYLPFKQKKRTLATEAKEKGLEPLAIAIWTRDPAVDKLDEVLPGMVDPWKQLHDVNDVLTGVKHILAEVIAESAEVRGPLRAFLWDTAILVTTKVETLPEGKGNDYRDYFAFKEPVRFIPPHRILAVNRGERENVIRIRIESNLGIAKEITLDNLPLADHPHREFLFSVVDDSLERLLMPSLEREIRRELTEHAQDHAVDIFSRNLRSLLLRPPLGNRKVLAIDPGMRTGCKVAVLDETGNLIEDAVIYPHPPQKKTQRAKQQLEQLIRKHQTSVIAIGNGTACRETEQLVSELLAEFENRRLNPPPPPSPIEPMTTSTSTNNPMASTEPSSDVSMPADTVTMPPASVTFAETTVIAQGLGASEPSLITSAGMDSAPAESSVVPMPSLETQVLPSQPAPAPTPAVDTPISLDGLPEPPEELAYVIVNEAGASDYSASPIAKEEFPDLDATTRGTVSIGRRLQDPLSELVKVDPQHVGVGLYQHDVRAKYLKQSVEAVIESCVNAVGVDLNSASVPLLRHVSGLNQLAAREIVEFRKQSGAFTSREQLKNVPQVGEARFTQAAGFLKIRDGQEPLDTTWVHPESYPLARQILADLEFTSADLLDPAKQAQIREKLRGTDPAAVAQRLNAGEPTIRDIFDAIARPGRDLREDRPEPIFRKGVLNLEDLKPGMELKGEVLNVVDFGAFVDVGLKDSGLVHISQIANRYIKSPYEVISVGDVVSVWVLAVDTERRRVSLTMIPPGQERRPPERRPPAEQRGPRPEPAPHQQQQGGPQDRPPPRAHSDRPPGQRAGFVPRPQGQPGGERSGPPRPAGGGPRPRGPGSPGWRSGPKSAAPGQGNASQAPAEGSQPPAPPPAKKPARQRPAPRLTDTQKTGKEPVYSFAQLAALLNTKQEPPPAPPTEEAPPTPPATETTPPTSESASTPQEPPSTN